MRLLDCGALAVCTDCILLIANHEASGEHRAKFARWQDEYGDGAQLVPGDDGDDFATGRCDGCGSTLAGARHEVYALVPDEVPA